MPVVVAASIGTGSALALDTTIADGQSILSSQVLAGRGDTLTVEAGGTIITAGEDGVVMDGDYQLLINRGLIATSSNYPVSVNGAHATILNFGTIESMGDCSYGVYATRDHFTLTNNGTIRTLGDANSFGVYVEFASRAAITNNGLIETSGGSAHAVVAYGAFESITNAGTISTSGDNTIGIYTWHTTGVASETTITNTGRIVATGANSQGIWSNAAGAVITNSGTIISEQAEAIVISQNDVTLRLLAGSAIEGVIKFSDDAVSTTSETATLEIGKGLNTRLTLAGIPGTIETNGQRYVLDGNVLIVASSDVMGATQGAAADVSGLVGDALFDRLGALHGSAGGNAALGYAAPPAPDFPDFAPGDDFGLWAGLYGGLERAVTGPDYSSVQGGALTGFDARLTEDSLAGLFVGIGRGVVDKAGGSTSMNVLMAGGYYSASAGPTFFDLSATAGGLFGRAERRILNNLVEGGIETASGDYASVFVSPVFRVGIEQDLGGAVLTPSLAIGYTGIYQNGYAESGSSVDLTYGSQLAHALSARAALELGTPDPGEAGRWVGSVKLGAEGSVSYGDAMSATLLGKPLSLGGGTSFEGRGFAGLDASYRSVGGLGLSTGAEVGLGTAGTVSASVKGGVGARF